MLEFLVFFIVISFFIFAVYVLFTVINEKWMQIKEDKWIEIYSQYAINKNNKGHRWYNKTNYVKIVFKDDKCFMVIKPSIITQFFYR